MAVGLLPLESNMVMTKVGGRWWGCSIIVGWTLVCALYHPHGPNRHTFIVDNNNGEQHNRQIVIGLYYYGVYPEER